MKKSYEELKSMATTFDQKNKYHNLLLWAHIDKAVNRAIELGYSAEIIEALRWHDFGKMFCYTEEDGVRHYIGHGDASADLYPGINETVKQLIKLHNDPITKKMIGKYGVDFCATLLQMQECDDYAHSDLAKANPENIKRQNQAKELIKSYSRNKKIQDRLKSDFDYLSGLGYEVMGVFLQGSQNYELDTDISDIDTKAIVLPNFNDFVSGKQPVSTTLVLDSNEHIDVKDIRVMFEVLRKSNVNFLEILFTKFKLTNKKYGKILSPLFINSEKFAMWNTKSLFNSIAGMAQQKYVALKHPYPSLIDKINKFGYDPKQLHHILRLHEFVERLSAGESFKRCLISNNQEYLKSVKYGFCNLEDAEKLSKEYVNRISEIKNTIISKINIEPDEAVLENYNEIQLLALKQWFREELLGEQRS